jgi:hypothetical protein
MTQTRKGLLATTPAPKMYEVPLDNGDTWRGTKRQLLAEHPDWEPYAREVQPPTRNTQADVVEQDFADDPRPGRLPNSSRRYAPLPGQKRVEYEYQDEIVHTTVPPRRSAQRTPHPNRNRVQPPDVIEAPPARSRYTEEPQAGRPRRHGLFGSFRSHPVLWLGFGMLLMLGLWQGLTALGNWWQVHQDDATYGRPRTAQYDVVLGHNDDSTHPTHIIAVNLNAHIVIIEIPGGDTSKSRIYSGPHMFGTDADLAPITLTFTDTTGDGRLDMIVHFQGGEIIYLNQKVNNVWQFVPQQSQ